MSKVMQRSQPVPTDIGQVAQSLLLAGTIGGMPQINTSAISAEVLRFSQDGQKALDQANRAVINSEETMGRAADLLKAISQSLSTQEAARKKHTAPLDTFKSKLMSLYKVGIDNLSEAKDLLKVKTAAFAREYMERQQAEAEAARKAQQEEAQRLAEAQAALGDADGADQILTEAAEMSLAPVKLSATGTYGATLGMRKTRSGKVVDTELFLLAVVSNSRQPAYAKFLAEMRFSQAQLNELARAVLDGDAPFTPGFEAEESNSITAR